MVISKVPNFVLVINPILIERPPILSLVLSNFLKDQQIQEFALKPSTVFNTFEKPKGLQKTKNFNPAQVGFIFYHGFHFVFFEHAATLLGYGFIK